MGLFVGCFSTPSACTPTNQPHMRPLQGENIQEMPALASCSKCPHVRVLWQVRTLSGVSGDVTVAFSPDGKWILSGSGDVAVSVSNAETGAVVSCCVALHLGQRNFVCFVGGTTDDLGMMQPGACPRQNICYR